MPQTRRRPRRAWIGIVAAVALAGAGCGLWAWWAEPVPNLESIRRAVAERRWADVEAGLERRVRARPREGEPRLLLAMMRVEQRRTAEAAELLGGVPESDPSRARARAMLGEIALQDHRASDAEHAFREAADLDPRAAEPRRRLVYILSLQQRDGEVRDTLWELFRIGHDPRLLIDLVLALWAVENDPREMGPLLTEYLERTPDDPFLRRARGLDLLMRGRPAEALPDLQAAADALVDDPVGRFALAECGQTLGDESVDPSILGPRPDAPADAARWWTLRARLQAQAGRDADARSSLERAVAVNPDDPEAHYRLGNLLIASGDEDSGREHLARSEAIRALHARVRREHTDLRRRGFDADPDLFERMARLCLDAGLVAEARGWYEQAIRADPTRSSAHAALAALRDDPRPLPFALSRPRLATTPDRPAPTTPSVLAESLAEARGPRFEDVAAVSGVTFAYDPAAKGDLYLGDTMGGGVGLIDFDEDGRLDLYFVNGCPLPYDPADPPRPNRLYRNNGDGTFTDVTAEAGVPGLGYGMGCAVGDYDGDGHDDLFVTGLGATVLYRNRGDGTFEDVTARAGVASDRWTTAAGFGDLDGDGDLDLVAVTYVEADPRDVPVCRDHSGGPIHCSPGLFPAQADHLYRNNGDGTFTDVAAESGFDGPEGRGLGLAIADLDDDGRLDLFVANDASADFAFRNLGDLRFEEVGLTTGLALNGSGKATGSMGVVADDLDGDGLLDLFVTNFLNESNSLFRGLGGGLFHEQAASAHLAAPSVPMTGFGTAAIDADNDGDLDLYVANGHVDDQPWINSPMAQPPHLFLNRGDGRFTLWNPPSPGPFDPTVARGVAAGDLDNDGLPDLVVVRRDAPALILRNATPDPGHFLTLRLIGDRSGHSPIGARVTLRAGGKTQVRRVTSGTSYLAAHDPRLHFGLADARTVDSLEVRWPSGLVQSWNDLPADAFLEVREGRDPTPAR